MAEYLWKKREACVFRKWGGIIHRWHPPVIPFDAIIFLQDILLWQCRWKRTSWLCLNARCVLDMHVHSPLCKADMHRSLARAQPTTYDHILPVFHLQLGSAPNKALSQSSARFFVHSRSSGKWACGRRNVRWGMATEWKVFMKITFWIWLGALRFGELPYMNGKQKEIFDTCW